ncbi:MAG: DUF333 domain-containing protein [Candidatus Aenigmatarchaeota archaeon]
MASMWNGKSILLIAVLGIVVFACGCISDTKTNATGSDVQIANPASAYCIEQGYTLDIRTDSSGGQYGVCVFPDGSECEEWKYFRSECKPGDNK